MLVKSHLYIPESKFTLKLKADLIFENPDYAKKIQQGLKLGDTPPIFQLYKEVKANNGATMYRVPRYALGDFNKLPNVIKKFGGSKIQISLKDKIILPDGEAFKLNNAQDKTIYEAVEALKTYNGAIIVAKPGEGKTSMSLHIIEKLGLKTLVLVHKNTLRDQWKEAIKIFFNITDDEIGLLQQGKFKDGKIVIGTQQSLMRATIGNEINSLFGLVIQDECFVGESKLVCSDGKEWSFIDVVKKVENNEEVLVCSYNEDKKVFEYKKVINSFRRGKKKVIKITFENNKQVICTPEHPILTKRGWIKAVYLDKEDEIIS